MIERTFNDVNLYAAIKRSNEERWEAALVVADKIKDVDKVREILDILGILDDLRELQESSRS